MQAQRENLDKENSTLKADLEQMQWLQEQYEQLQEKVSKSFSTIFGVRLFCAFKRFSNGFNVAVFFTFVGIITEFRIETHRTPIAPTTTICFIVSIHLKTTT